MSEPVLIVLMAIFGLAVGSFLNVVIVRVPAGESLLSPPSKCPLCETPIANRDNIPVLSWILLKGKCRSCGEPIPSGYPLVEAGNALLWVLAALRFEHVSVAVAYAVFFSVLLALSVIDLELYILPNRITYPSIVASLPILGGLAYLVADDPGATMISVVIGGVGFAGILLVTLIGWELIVHKEGMGMGDVKLALLLGMWLGWINVLLPVYALIASSVLGLLAGLVILAVRRESRAFPFGPWLAIGTIVVILAAGPILRSQGFDDEGEGSAPAAASASFGVTGGR